MALILIHHRRVWIYGQRIHHGALGVLLVTLGALLACHDRRDHKDWFRRCR